MDLITRGKDINLNKFNGNIMSWKIEEYRLDYKDKNMKSQNYLSLMIYCTKLILFAQEYLWYSLGIRHQS